MGRQGKAGFHSGEMRSATAKVGGRHVINKDHIPLQDFTIGFDIVSGADAAVLSGAASLGFKDGIAKTTTIATTIMTPPNIRPSTKADVVLYWAPTSGTAAGVGVIWDLDYRTVSVAISGTTVTGINYTTSGTTISNVTTTHAIISGGTTGSVSALQRSVLTIPATDIEKDSLLIMNIYRDTAESGDTATNNASIVAVQVEYVEG